MMCAELGGGGGGGREWLEYFESGRGRKGGIAIGKRGGRHM